MKESRFNSSDIPRKKNLTTERKNLMSICTEREVSILRVDDDNDIDEDTLKWIND